jgi:hypothetical protein
MSDGLDQEMRMSPDEMDDMSILVRLEGVVGLSARRIVTMSDC